MSVKGDLKRKIKLYRSLGKQWSVLPGMWHIWLLYHGGADKLPKAKGILGSRQLSYPEAIHEALDCFAPDADQKEREKLRRDIVRAAIKNNTTPAEYFIFGFKDLPDSKRKNFVSRREKNIYMARYVKSLDDIQLLMDKSRFYQRFQEFFCREMCEFTHDGDNAEFKTFCARHRSYIAKAKAGRMGVGTVIRHHEGTEEAIRSEVSFLSESGDDWVVEELIKQDERMAALHPTSVNTVRLCTRWIGNDIHVFEAFVRMGQGGAVVDNICSGGLSAEIDHASGHVISDAIDHLGLMYETHPTTGIRFRDFQIPCWSELLDVARKAHAIIPDYPYVGWDFALSEEHGWVLVEGNWGNFITQYLKRGIRDEFIQCFQNSKKCK